MRWALPVLALTMASVLLPAAPSLAWAPDTPYRDCVFSPTAPVCSPGRVEPVVDASVGPYHSCVVLVTGNVDCFGYSPNSAAMADRVLGDAVSVFAGNGYTCALLRNGNVACWGSAPTTGWNAGDAVAIAGDYNGWCLLTATRNVHCFGAGYGLAQSRTLGDALSVSVAWDRVCVLLVTRNVVCWGYEVTPATPEYEGGDAIAVAALSRGLCVIRAGDGAAICKRAGYFGTTIFDRGIVDMAASGAYVCLLTRNGDVACRDISSYGNVLTRFGGDAAKPRTMAYGICAVTTSGTLDCWGAQYESYDYPYPQAHPLVPLAPSGDSGSLSGSDDVPTTSLPATPGKDVAPVDVPGTVTPDVPATPGAATPDVPAQGGVTTPDVPAGSGETPDVPPTSPQPTPDVPPQGGQATPDVPSQGGVVTPDAPPTGGQATPDVPPTAAVPTPPVGVVAGTLDVYDSGTYLCTGVTPSGGPRVEIACIEKAALGPAAPLVPRGSTPLVAADPPDVPATGGAGVPDVPPTSGQAVPDVPATGIVPVPDVPATPGQQVPDIPATPGQAVPDGPPTPGAAVPDVPATSGQAIPDAPGTPGQAVPDVPPSALPGIHAPSLVVSVGTHRDEAPAQSTPIVTLLGGAVVVRRPFEPTAAGASWFLTHGSDTALRVTIVVEADGEVLLVREVVVPWVGQVVGLA